MEVGEKEIESLEFEARKLRGLIMIYESYVTEHAEEKKKAEEKLEKVLRGIELLKGLN